MKNKPVDDAQSQFLMSDLSSLLNPRHSLYRLANELNWSAFEEAFGKHYANYDGTPAKPIRLMVSLLILKQLYDLSDESVVKQWVQNPYFQYFSGESQFQWALPIDPTSLVKFRKRIGEAGSEKILEVSVRLHGKACQEKEVVADTTVQEKNITYPTDSKLHHKIIQKCVSLADKESIRLRRSYRRTVPSLMKAQHNRTHPKRQRQARAAARKLKTIAGLLVRELRRKLPSSALARHGDSLDVFDRVLAQKQKDKNKIYSLHELDVCCISKGKEHKKYEFGQKAIIVRTKNSGIIVGAQSCPNNPYDGHVLPDALTQAEQLTGKRVAVCLVDRGFRGIKDSDGTEVLMPSTAKKNDSPYQKQKARKRFRKRAGIEPVMGHLKSDFRMRRNFLKGLSGDVINVHLAAAAFNFKKWLNALLFYTRKGFSSAKTWLHAMHVEKKFKETTIFC